VGGAQDGSAANDIGKDDREVLISFDLRRIQDAHGEGLADLIVIEGKDPIGAEVLQAGGGSAWDGCKIYRDNARAAVGAEDGDGDKTGIFGNRVIGGGEAKLARSVLDINHGKGGFRWTSQNGVVG